MLEAVRRVSSLPHWHPGLVSPEREADRERGGSRRRRPQIVLVEDDSDIGLMYRIQLESDGFEIHHAQTGPDGLRLIRSLKPDLVLLDLRLPGMDGFEILSAVRGDAELEALPMVVISNFGDPEMIARARELGALDYLIKSSTLPEVLSQRVSAWTRTTDPLQ